MRNIEIVLRWSWRPKPNLYKASKARRASSAITVGSAVPRQLRGGYDQGSLRNFLAGRTVENIYGHRFLSVICICRLSVDRRLLWPGSEAAPSRRISGRSQMSGITRESGFVQSCPLICKRQSRQRLFKTQPPLRPPTNLSGQAGPTGAFICAPWAASHLGM
jgi:hypothetical protein